MRKPMKLWRSVNDREPMQIVNRKSKIVNGRWLPDMDLNHDKQIQSLLCYRYTIGQAGALDRLEGFMSESSCQTCSTLEKSNGVYARPHPGPLPRGEGAAARVSRTLGRHKCNHRYAVIRPGNRTIIYYSRMADNRRTILPLPGERAGVRADVTTHFFRSRFSLHVSRN